MTTALVEKGILMANIIHNLAFALVAGQIRIFGKYYRYVRDVLRGAVSIYVQQIFDYVEPDNHNNHLFIKAC